MKKLIFFILVVQVCFLNGCKKYPDGPLISFYSAKNRITGTWYYDHILENNVDLVGLVKCNKCESSGIHFLSDGDGDDVFSTLRSDSTSVNGRWYIPNHEKYIQLKYSFSNWPPIGPLFNIAAKDTEWRIRRLSQHEFWITCDYKGSHYEVNWYK